MDDVFKNHTSYDWGEFMVFVLLNKKGWKDGDTEKECSTCAC